MESVEAEIMIVAYIHPYKWCVVNAKTLKIISKDYSHEDAVASVEAIAYRISQGWQL